MGTSTISAARAGLTRPHAGVSTTVKIAGAIVLASTTLVPNHWVQWHLALRFMLVLCVTAVGLPCLLPLLRRGVPVVSSPAFGGEARLEPERWRLIHLAAIFGAGFAGWAVLSALLSASPALSILGRYDWATGAVFVAAMVGAWAIGICAGRPATSAVETILLITVGLSAAFALLQTVVDFSGIALGTYDGRATGLWTNPVYLGAFLVGGFWVVARRVPDNPLRWGLLCILVAAGIQVTGSRFALGLLVVAAGAAFFAIGIRPALMVAGFVVVGLALGAGLASVGAGSHVIGTSRAAEDSSGYRSRIETWREAPKEVARRPILGVGPGQFETASSPDRTLAMARAEGPDGVFTDAHNVIVEYGVTTGIPGLLLLLGFVGLALALSGWRSPLAGFGVLVLAMHLVQPLHPSLTPLALLALGVAGGGPQSLRRAGPPRARAGLIGIAAAIGLLITVGSVRLFQHPFDISASAPNIGTARALLFIWALPYERSAEIQQVMSPPQISQALPLSASGADPSAATIRGFLIDATRREPAEPVWWIGLAEFDASVGNRPAAEAEYERALRYNPWATDALNGLATMLTRDGQVQQARSLLLRSLKADPAQPKTREQLATLVG